MKLWPSEFMPVRTKERHVQDWDDLERIRAQHAPVLGSDDWYETFKYNLSSLLFCDLMSKAFVWVIISTCLLIHFGVKDSSLLIYNLVGSLLHFAAKDEFKRVVAALCNRWGGPNSNGGNNGIRTDPTQPTIK